MSSNVKVALFWLAVAGVCGGVWLGVRTYKADSAVPFSALMDSVSKGQIKSTKFEDSDVSAVLRDGRHVRSTVPAGYTEIYRILLEKNIPVEVEQAKSLGWTSSLVSALPILLLGALFLYMNRQMQSGGNKALSFGKSRARLLQTTQKKATFKDVAGAEDAKTALQETVEFLREPIKFQKLGARIPKGVLLIGPPGTGKTLLARAIAGEANVPFFAISGSDFVEMFVGVGASRVRDLFEQGKKNAPCIIFIDEIDAVGRHRGAGLGGGHDEREQTLNQLLVEMDGFESNEGVILVAATNRPDVLDTALLRPGRFDRTVLVPLPTVKGRESILKVHSAKIPMADDVTFRSLAEQTSGFAGADLANIVNEAALIAARADRKAVAQSDFEIALDKVRRGRSRRLFLESTEDKWRVAVHEVGHLIVGLAVPGMQKLQGVSLHSPYRPDWFDREVTSLPEVVTLEAAKATLVVLLAGRAAEWRLFQQVSSFCASDTAVATALAYRMISRWGMNEEIGLVNTAISERNVSSDSLSSTAKEGEDFVRERGEIKKLLDDAYTNALSHIEQNIESVIAWSVKLFEQETLSAHAIDQLEESSRFKMRVALKSRDSHVKSLTIGDGVTNGSAAAAAPAEATAVQVKTAETLRKHRDILKMQIAALGLNAPAHLLIQLEDIERQIETA